MDEPTLVRVIDLQTQQIESLLTVQAGFVDMLNCHAKRLDSVEKRIASLSGYVQAIGRGRREAEASPVIDLQGDEQCRPPSL